MQRQWFALQSFGDIVLTPHNLDPRVRLLTPLVAPQVH